MLPPSILKIVIWDCQWNRCGYHVASDPPARLAVEPTVHVTRSTIIAANTALSSVTVPRLPVVLESHRVRILGSHLHFKDERKLAVDVFELAPRGIDVGDTTHRVLQCIGESHV